ncbi:TPA: LysR family transcriptional regulator [Klebsiella variicola subsp. variicola]
MFDDFDELMAFVCVAEAGSFIGASLRLERDASVISRRVSHLEKKLGVRLLVRTTRSVTLTEAGTWFLQRARTALDELSAASREVGDFAATPQGTLRVSLPVTFGRELIARCFLISCRRIRIFALMPIFSIDESILSRRGLMR